jgi:hypothetical protein
MPEERGVVVELVEQAQLEVAPGERFGEMAGVMRI